MFTQPNITQPPPPRTASFNSQLRRIFPPPNASRNSPNSNGLVPPAMNRLPTNPTERPNKPPLIIPRGGSPSTGNLTQPIGRPSKPPLIIPRGGSPSTGHSTQPVGRPSKPPLIIPMSGGPSTGQSINQAPSLGLPQTGSGLQPPILGRGNNPSNRFQSGLPTMGNPTTMSSPFMGGLLQGSNLKSRYFSPNERREIVMPPWQAEHYQRIKGVIQSHVSYIDTTETGLGKSYVAMKLIQDQGFLPLVVCPATVEGDWAAKFEMHGISYLGILSYESLRSQKYKQPKHGLLNRLDLVDGGRNKLVFEPTDLLLNYLDQQPILLILDENQKAKNIRSAQTEAACALANAVAARPNAHHSNCEYKNSPTRKCRCPGNRIALLSRTPIDKVEHIISFLRLSGIITNKTVRHKDDDYTFNFVGTRYSQLSESDRNILDRYTKSAIYEIYYFIIHRLRPANPARHHKWTKDQLDKICEDNNEKYKEIVNLTGKRTKDLGRCYILFCEILKPHVSSAAVRPANESNLDIANGFYSVPKNTAKYLAYWIDYLANVTRNRQDDEGFVLNNDNISVVNRCLMKIEFCMFSTFLRLVRRDLESNPNKKVIVAFNYLKSVDRLREELKEYNPLVLTGSCTKKARARLIESFNNDPNSRLMITIITVGGVGISLHDLIGNFPRISYASPSYKMQDIKQFAGRTDRVGSKSRSTMRVIYGLGEHNVKLWNVLSSLARKSQVTRGALFDGADTNKIILPGDYGEIVEQEDREITNSYDPYPEIFGVHED